MATYCVAKDGHPYLLRGYPFRNEEDTVVSTYQVAPNGAYIFDYMRARNGDVVSRNFFYALYLDGAIFHQNTPSLVSIYDLPQDYAPDPFSNPTGEVFGKVNLELATTRRLSLRSVLDLFESYRIAHARDLLPKDIVELTSLFFISAKRREETDRLRDGLSPY